MTAFARASAAGTLVLLGLALTAPTAPAPPPRAPQAAGLEKDLDALAGELQKARPNAKKVRGLVAGILRGKGLEEVMAKVYKPTKKGGIGYRPGYPRPRDGIEKRIMELALKPMKTREDLLAEAPLLKRMLAYNLAVAEVNSVVPPPRHPDKGPVEWNRHNDQMQLGTKEAARAVDAADPAALRRAMTKIITACNDCHSDFR